MPPKSIFRSLPEKHIWRWVIGLLGLAPAIRRHWMQYSSLYPRILRWCVGVIRDTSTWGIPSTSQPLWPVSLPGFEEIYAFQSQASETWWWPRWTSMLQSRLTVINLGWATTCQYFNENSWNTGSSGLQTKLPLHRQWLESMWLSPRLRWKQVHFKNLFDRVSFWCIVYIHPIS